ncbi:MAG: NADH dehydrogenase [ubiquinone] 1 alpha subcomplex assembly factor 1 [Planctomycetota bacterium]|jgi:NADH dehydrogenase [ubiquinone] 1 alpha subcomplex assembly factor 1
MPNPIETLILGAMTLFAAPDATLNMSRTQAAGELRQAMALSSRSGIQAQLQGLADAGGRAAALLENEDQSREIERLVFDTASKGLYSVEEAIDRLSRAYQTIVGDLEFRIRREAELPRGFPAPTAVGELELKRYPSYRRVRADAGRAAFWRLFRHIKANDIAMTAPVEMGMYGEVGNLREVDMAFLYADPDQGVLGEAGSVVVLDQAAAWVLSLGCRGSNSERAVESARQRIERWLTRNTEYVAAGNLRVMGYNSPMTPASKRFFEVQIPVQRRVVRFESESDTKAWQVVNDSVMGGVSTSQMRLSGLGWAIFEGDVSLDNNGGFASVRAEVKDGAFSEAERIRIRFRGDGKSYKLRLRTSRQFNAVNYEASFDTVSGQWMEIDLPIQSFRPVWRGRRVTDAPVLDSEAITGVGLMISGGQVGTFRLELAAIDIT